MTPTAGGQHHYVSSMRRNRPELCPVFSMLKLLSSLTGLGTEFAPRRWQRPLSYCSGWMSAISWLGTVTVNSYVCGGIMQAVITVNNPTYEPTNWTRTLLTILTVVLVAAFNTFAASHISFAEGVFATFHVFALVPVCVTLWVMVSPKTSPSDVFIHFKDYTGSWSSIGLSVFVGQTTAIFSTIRCDAVAHMAEDVEKFAEVVPSGMVWSFFLNTPLTFIMMLTYVFNIGSVDSALRSQSPFVQVFDSALKVTGATTTFALVVLLLMFVITISTMVATSRQAFAFACDGGLPFSQWITRIYPRFGVPVNAIVFAAGFTSVLALINTGSTVAFETMLSLSTASFMATCALSIGCMTFNRFEKQPIPRAQWSLGKAGLPINCMALVYAVWACFWSFWPVQSTVTASNFNWAGVFFVGLMSVAWLFYLGGAKRVYEGPGARGQRRMNEW